MNESNLDFIEYVPRQEAVSLVALGTLMAEILRQRGIVRLRVRGPSMVPFLRNNDVVTIAPLDIHQPKVGTAVLFFQPTRGIFLIHRVVGLNGDGYILKGDTLFNSEGLIPRKYIFGYLTKIERNTKIVTLGLGLERRIFVILSKSRALAVLSRLKWLATRYRFKRQHDYTK